MTEYRRALEKASEAGLISERLIADVLEEVRLTGHSPSIVASTTGGEPLSERAKNLAAFLEELGA